MQIRRSFFLLLLFFLGLASAAAQSPYEAFYYKADSFLDINKDSTYYYYQKSFEIAQRHENVQGQLVVLVSAIQANGQYYDLFNFKKNLEAYEGLLQTEQAQEDPYYHYFKENYLFEKVNYAYKLKDYDSALEAIKDLEAFLDAHTPDELDMDCYDTRRSNLMFKAATYSSTGKYSLAEEQYKKILRFIDKEEDSLYYPESSRIGVKRLLSDNYSKQGQYEVALSLQQDVLAHYKAKDTYLKNTNSGATALFNLIDLYIRTGNAQEALGLYQSTPEIFYQNPRFALRYYSLGARIAVAQQNFEKAVALYDRVYTIAVEYRGTIQHPDVAQVYIDIATMYLKKRDFTRSMEAVVKGKFALGYDDTASQEVSQLSDARLYLQLLSLQITIYNEHKAGAYLDQDKDTVTLQLLETLDFLLPTFETKLDKEFLIDSTFPALQEALALQYELYERYQNDHHLYLAFLISEKSKAILLKEATQQAQAIKKSKIPDDVLQQGLLLKSQIAQLEKLQFVEQQNDVVLLDSLFNLKEQYRAYTRELETTYPLYYKLKYGTDTVSLEEAQQFLGRDEWVVSYSEGNQFLYIIAFSQDQALFKRIPYTKELRGRLRTYYSKMSTASVDQTASSVMLGETLLAPVVERREVSRLHIVPDGLLHYIPFETLRLGETLVLFKSTVSYASSVDLWLKNQSETTVAASVLAVAPSFQGENPKIGERSQLNPLLYNVEEVEAVAEQMPAEVLIGEEASIVRFRESVDRKRSGIYHFATHAVANDTLPDYSYLAFTPKEDTTYLLYASDLYTLDLKGAFVVLSACETGVGKLQRGDGMRSLSQAFDYAGASGLVHSKWKVSDRTTAQLMAFFYEYLAEGNPKDEALTLAKRRYLQKQDDPAFKHPYYWAGFVLSGNTAPAVNRSSVWLWLLLSILLLSLGYFFLRRR